MSVLTIFNFSSLILPRKDSSEYFVPGLCKHSYYEGHPGSVSSPHFIWFTCDTWQSCDHSFLSEALFPLSPRITLCYLVFFLSPFSPLVVPLWPQECPRFVLGLLPYLHSFLMISSCFTVFLAIHMLMTSEFRPQVHAYPTARPSCQSTVHHLHFFTQQTLLQVNPSKTKLTST